MAPTQDAPSAPSLLLLPAPPTPANPASLNSAYSAPLSDVLSKLKQASTASRQAPTLIIAIASPILSAGPPQCRTVKWKTAQSLLAGVYSIIAALCAEQNIKTDIGAGAGSVDARVMLVDHERKRNYSKTSGSSSYERNCTPVLDLASFATTALTPWSAVYHPSTEAGYELLAAYLALAEGKQTFLQKQLVAVQGGLSLSVAPQGQASVDISSSPAASTDKIYNTVVLGGTFDHVHPGHKLLLHATALLLRIPKQPDSTSSTATPTSTLIVGITGDAMLQNKKYAEELESWEARCQSVFFFLSTIFNSSPAPQMTQGPSGKEMQASYVNDTVLVRCCDLQDAFGPTISEEALDAIVVSGETRGGGQAVNNRRKEKGWHELDVYEIDVLDARGLGDGAGDKSGQDFTAKISSTAIRQQRAEARAKAQI